MTKKHIDYAAALVRNVRQDGRFPGIEIESVRVGRTPGDGNIDVAEFIARQHAHAYMQLFSAYNPRFDEARFLKACGLD